MKLHGKQAQSSYPLPGEAPPLSPAIPHYPPDVDTPSKEDINETSEPEAQD